MHHLRFPADWVDDADREYPQRVFLRTDTGRELNYASLRDESGRFASALMRRGVRAGERVAAHVDKSAEAVLLYVACLRMGAVFLPINVANTPAEVDYVLRDAQASIAILRPSDLASLEPLARRAQIPPATSTSSVSCRAMPSAKCRRRRCARHSGRCTARTDFVRRTPRPVNGELATGAITERYRCVSLMAALC